MELDQINELEALRIAVEIEENGYEFYTKAIERVSDMEAKGLFQRLAREEKAHAARFQAIYDKYLADNPTGSDEYIYDPEVSSYLKAISMSAVFPPAGEIDDVIEQITDLYDVLDLALQVEKDSILYYSELAVHAKNPAAKSAFSALISEERKHVIDIQRLLDLLDTDSI